MEYRITELKTKKLVGKRMTMSFANNKTYELWNAFMLRRYEIQNKLGSELYSLQIYPPSFFANFNPETEFEKWATCEVNDFDNVPDKMETFSLKGGLYAVFRYKGNQSQAASAFRYIMGTWLQNSLYIIDDRPHFEILGEKYKNDDPDSEEEIWIPILKKE